MKDCTLSRKQLFQDILSYNLELIGCSEKSTDEEISTATGFEEFFVCLCIDRFISKDSSFHYKFWEQVLFM